MKKVVMLFAALCVFAVSSFAQTADQAGKMDKKEGMAGQKPESWKKLLDLSPDQDAKMKEIGKAYKEKSEALKNDTAMGKEDKKAKKNEMQATNEADLKAVLGADKFAKYIEIRNQRREAQKAQQGMKEAEKN